MADEIVYADLSLPSGPSLARLPHPSQGCSASRCQRIALWVGWTGNVILLVGVIVLAFQIKEPVKIQEKACVSEGPTNCTDQQDNLSQFRQSICNALNSSLAGGSKCQLCPVNWLLQKRKCYWFSKDKKGWFEAYSDCARKGAQMLVKMDLEIMESIRDIKVWIGLNFTSPGKKWTWVDGSLADPDSIAEASSTAKTAVGF